MCALKVEGKGIIESSLFNPSLPELPDPFVAMVLKKLSDHDLVNMTKLNRAWCAFIFNYDSLSCRFIPHQCVYAAKNLASKLVGIELNPRKKVIGLEARINHVRAIATSLSFNQTEVDAFNLRCMPGGDHRIEVVKVLALQNLESAKTLASQIEDSSSRDLAFYKIVEIEVKENAVSAAATAERIRNLELFSQACAAMAENAPVLYLDRLIQIHQHPFIDPFSRVILQVIIAKLRPLSKVLTLS